jgi:hypothetical protein
MNPRVREIDYRRCGRTEDLIGVHRLCPLLRNYPTVPHAFRHSVAPHRGDEHFLTFCGHCKYRKSISDLICPFASFRFILGRRNNSLLLSIFPGLSFTALGNPERPRSYYWPYYASLVISGVSATTNDLSGSVGKLPTVESTAGIQFCQSQKLLGALQLHPHRDLRATLL